VRHLAGVQLGHRLGGEGAGDNLLFGFLWRFQFAVGEASPPYFVSVSDLCLEGRRGKKTSSGF
jgi:hypothetical protein